MRYFIELSYLGTAYHGWQKQPGAVTVQEKIEAVLVQLFQEKIEIVGAGRTDAGVHATQMFAHVDLSGEIDEQQLMYKMNLMLPRDIAIANIFKVKQDAHARFDASSRSYEYHIIQHKSPFLIDRAYFLLKDIDLEKMNMAAAMLFNYTNFKSFSRSKTDVKTYNCKIEIAHWKQENDKLIFNITANRFLRNMVRAIVGTLLEIGLGKINVEDFPDIISSEDRSKAGASVPAAGLFLTKIEYPKNIAIQ